MAAKKKTLPKKDHVISLGEYSALRGVKETVIAGFKVWLKKATARSLSDWDKALKQFLNS